MTQQEILACLERKREIIKKLAANTATESRFIPRQEMKGMQRVLKERDVLLQELAAVNKDLAKDTSWKTDSQYQALVAAIQEEQQAVLKDSAKVLEAAKLERDKIKHQLQQIRLKKRVQNQYEGSGQAYSGRINTRG